MQSGIRSPTAVHNQNRPDPLPVIETRNFAEFGAVRVRERQRVHFVVDVRDGHIGLVADDVLTKKASVNMSVISGHAANAANGAIRTNATYCRVSSSRGRSIGHARYHDRHHLLR